LRVQSKQRQKYAKIPQTFFLMSLLWSLRNWSADCVNALIREAYISKLANFYYSNRFVWKNRSVRKDFLDLVYLQPTEFRSRKEDFTDLSIFRKKVSKSVQRISGREGRKLSESSRCRKSQVNETMSQVPTNRLVAFAQA
jgi:hypothetical protein